MSMRGLWAPKTQKHAQRSAEGAKTYQNDATNASKVSASGFKAPKIELNVLDGGLSSKVYIIYILISIGLGNLSWEI